MTDYYSKVKKLGWVVLDPEKKIYIKYVCGNFLIIDFEKLIISQYFQDATDKGLRIWGTENIDFEGDFTFNNITLELFVLVEQRFNFRKMEQVCRFGIDNKFVQGIINSL
jgi:hypothetical protein